MKKILPTHTNPRGKWMPNYKGPYIVRKVFSIGAFILATMDGEYLSSPVNADASKNNTLKKKKTSPIS